MSKEAAEDRVKTIERMFIITDALQELNGARISELGDYTDLANSTVYRHLNTLNDMGYVMKEGDIYHIGLGFLDIGEYARNRKKAYQLAKPKVQELAEATDERCQFVVEEHGRGVYVHVETGSHAVETNSRIGKRLYLHSTSVGKSILAHLPNQRISEIVDKWGLPKRTENTITSREGLKKELHQIREDGVAYNREGNIKGLRSVGTPVLSPSGQILGALSISGPTHRMKGDKYEETLPDLLLGAANELELNLEYS
ncbi:IclR family transcriptional regulator [Halorarum salinum]|uniref:IclR family transcriptional regulator n=1 Tax=Halorarum salinum TaxID=2743089 RepID=A0A7D5L818_9EURY|nr:IclR family transcriptional regulator [Halobaculum salinum]QLG60313.1 IclR family transcriptional regulator [Halobaculum salinum]